MKTLTILLLAAAMLSACGQRKSPEQQTEKDSVKAMKESMDHVPSSTVNFITDAAITNIKEIRLGRLAKSKAADERIRRYGAMMEKDHSLANQQLDSIAKLTGVTMPTELTGEDKKTEETLFTIKYTDFDKTYIKEMIAGHKKTLAMFENAKNSKDTAISRFAESMIPTLNKHLDEALTILEDMRKQINKSNKSIQ
ncbi:putative membrane protein [Chitinophaga terrae (ex Kim and Jung 2007)]|uniref:Putative membrane protein n=1 Tax=Chitinophaga terrae (ex Kim and Jung 2007) TaxID=408074 RepID=A0A1H4EWG6_9BACT|nr:DUF4142 domain-containing protein [Chitinophaga terrae (ex Kim and Jung 2007)]GEP90671.1 hypothetical protein CTE07_23160 [Chitinophaga terrae (ex Kim and Jung 2007)]SEA89331.1 putative membrane protein [Chitinophaga terrae (ex Kim and Jung 2007)]